MSKEQLRSAGGVEYTLVRRKVKNINLRIRPNGTVAASASPWVSAGAVDAFVADHADWVARARVQLQRRAEQKEATPLPDKAEALARFTALTRQALVLFPGAEMPAVKIRDMSTRWGVCHIQKHSITYAQRLAAMPPAAQQYVVVHELCHFLVPNHSAAFWAEVAVRMPDWKARRQMLKG